MGYTFRLQTLLNYKRNLEELSQIRLADRHRALSLQDDLLRRLEEMREANHRAFRQKTAAAAPLRDLVGYLEFRDQSFDQRLRLEAGRTRILAEIEKERGRLIALTQDRKILEKLKEKQERVFMRDLEKRERKTLEDLVVQRYAAGERES